MNTRRGILPAVVLSAAVLVAVTGCGAEKGPLGSTATTEEREAYEASHFRTPEGETASALALEELEAEAMAQQAPAGGVANTLLNPGEWPAKARAKLCSYTADLMAKAEREGTSVDRRTRETADRILARC